MRIKKKLAIMCMLIGLILASSINRSSATLVWEEDFENPPYNDWFLHSYYIYPYSAVNYNNLVITNGSLHQPTPDGMQIFATHDSSVAYGTWSFDVQIVPIELYKEFEIYGAMTEIMFIGNFKGYSEPKSFNLSGYDFSQVSDRMKSYALYIISGISRWGLPLNSISLYLWIGRYYQSDQQTQNIWQSIGFSEFSSPINGSHHIDITRGSAGEFKVYFDSELLFQVTNNEITTSTFFDISTFVGNLTFDNLTFCDSVGSCPPTTTTTTTMTTNTTTLDTTPTTTTTDSGTFGFEFGVLILVLICSVFVGHKQKR
ncbi:MAG: hypothetical protein ACFFB5_09150 [Promethearchaeota archaeon]